MEQVFIAVSAWDNTKKAWNILKIKCPKEVVGASNMVFKVEIEMIENHLISNRHDPSCYDARIDCPINLRSAQKVVN